MTVTSGAPAEPQLDAGRGERTRSAILDASRRLFLERGYAGTPINAITEACGISRAGFYTYFKDKREVFNVLGKTAYHDVLAVIAEWAEADEPFGPADISAWVGHYFDYMDHHGAFVLASVHSAPDDEAFRISRNRMVTRASWKLGQAIAAGGAHSPDVIGVAVMGLLDRAWHTVHRQTVAVDREEMIAVVAEMIVAMAAPAASQYRRRKHTSGFDTSQPIADEKSPKDVGAGEKTDQNESATDEDAACRTERDELGDATPEPR